MRRAARRPPRPAHQPLSLSHSRLSALSTHTAAAAARPPGPPPSPSPQLSPAAAASAPLRLLPPSRPPRPPSPPTRHGPPPPPAPPRPRRRPARPGPRPAPRLPGLGGPAVQHPSQKGGRLAGRRGGRPGAGHARDARPAGVRVHLWRAARLCPPAPVGPGVWAGRGRHRAGFSLLAGRAGRGAGEEGTARPGPGPPGVGRPLDAHGRVPPGRVLHLFQFRALRARRDGGGRGGRPDG